MRGAHVGGARKTCEDIATIMSIAERTVNFHLNNAATSLALRLAFRRR